MVNIVYCDACRSALQESGIASSLYTDICDVYVNYSTPIEVHSPDRDFYGIYEIIVYLEKNGYIVTTESAVDLLYAKPTGLTYDHEDGQIICRICPKCNTTRTKS
jgi:hypothetical protein